MRRNPYFLFAPNTVANSSRKERKETDRNKIRCCWSLPCVAGDTNCRHRLQGCRCRIQGGPRISCEIARDIWVFALFLPLVHHMISFHLYKGVGQTLLFQWLSALRISCLFGTILQICRRRIFFAIFIMGKPIDLLATLTVVANRDEFPINVFAMVCQNAQCK